MPPSPRDSGLDFWRGHVATRLEAVDESIKRLDTTMELVKKELMDSNLKVARSIGAIGVLLFLVTILAPYLTARLFGGNP